jgi:hypothetical protein
MSCQPASTRCQMVQALAGGRIQALYECGIDTTSSILCSFDQTFHPFLAAANNMALNRQDTFYKLFDDLHNSDVRRGNHFAAVYIAMLMGERILAVNLTELRISKV